MAVMRMMVMIGLSVLLAICGCARKKALLPPTATVPAAPSGYQKASVAPEATPFGHVVWVNTGGHFVVLNYPIGKVPAVDRRFNLYRRGQKVGEVKIVGPQSDENIVADIVSGDAEKGDEARDQ